MTAGAALLLLAAQPLPVALLAAMTMVAGAGPETQTPLVTGVLLTALLDLLVVPRVSPPVRVVAAVLTRLATLLGVVYGLLVVWSVPSAADALVTTLVLALAGLVALHLRRDPRLAGQFPAARVVAGAATGVVALAVAGVVLRLGGVVDVLAIGLVLATAVGVAAAAVVSAYRSSRAWWVRRRREADMR